MSCLDDQAISGARLAMDMAGVEMILRRTTKTLDEETQKWIEGSPTDYSLMIVRDTFTPLEVGVGNIEATDLKLFGIPKKGEDPFAPNDGANLDRLFLGDDPDEDTEVSVLGVSEVWAHEELVGWWIHARSGR